MRLIRILESQQEIAIDLEHCDYHNYRGYICLMQLSTRNDDYLIDTLKLWPLMHKLNKIFTDPNIVKVMHGAESDILWLQRDFGIYCVNLFDTHQAAQLYGGPLSLSGLLRRYCNIGNNAISKKKFQRADWSKRPLPESMVQYAAQDTRYLLHIYDQMRNELWQRAQQTDTMIRTALERSKNVCLKRYDKSPSSKTSSLSRGMKKHAEFLLTDQQVALLHTLFKWRDAYARRMDMAPQSVLYDGLLLSIVTQMPSRIEKLFSKLRPTWQRAIKVFAADLNRILQA